MANPAILTRQDALQRYGVYFATLKPAGLARLPQFVTDDVRFRDPFNDVRGRSAMAAILQSMFDQLHEPRFEITDQAVGANAGYLRWTMYFSLPRNKPWSITGMTEIHFDEVGKITAHLDHWDAAGHVYERIPLLGSLLRVVRRRLAH